MELSVNQLSDEQKEKDVCVFMRGALFCRSYTRVRSGENFFNHSPFIDRCAFGTTLTLKNKLLVIQSSKVKDRGMNIVYVGTVLYCVQTKIICLTDDSSSTGTSACHPDSESVRVVIASISFF